MLVRTGEIRKQKVSNRQEIVAEAKESLISQPEAAASAFLFLKKESYYEATRQKKSSKNRHITRLISGLSSGHGTFYQKKDPT